MTPRFDPNEFFQGRGLQAINAMKDNPELPIRMLLIHEALSNESLLNTATARHIGVMQIFTAKDGGMHIINQIRRFELITRDILTPLQQPFYWYATFLLSLEADAIKFNQDSLLISWRISTLDKDKIRATEAKIAQHENREPVDYFADNYNRKLPIGVQNLNDESKATKLESMFREDYPELLTVGAPLNNPEDFFI